MNKNQFKSLAKLFGFNVVINEEDEDAPMTIEMLEGEDEETEDPVVDPAQATPQPEPVAAELPAEVVALNSLVTEFGGIQAMKTLLTQAASVVAVNASAQNAMRKQLVDKIIANSAEGVLTEADLKDVPLPALQKWADVAAAPIGPVHFGPLGSITRNASGSEQAPRPTFLLNKEAHNGQD